MREKLKSCKKHEWREEHYTKYRCIKCGYSAQDNVHPASNADKLVPLDKDKLREFMKARGYDSETMTDSICQTFGQPKDAMSVPTVEEINKVLLESPRHKYNYETKEYDTQAKAIHALFTAGKVNAQRQDSLADQMNTVIDLARKEGCYDAQDWIIRTFGSEGKGER